jgi:AbrB family looped-hinge helix DNA binding protein
MPLVRVKEKFQVTLPASVRQRTGLAVGDLLEANVEGKTITLTPNLSLTASWLWRSRM